MPIIPQHMTLLQTINFIFDQPDHTRILDARRHASCPNVPITTTTTSSGCLAMSALCDQHDTFIHGSNIRSRRARIPQTYGTRDATIIDFHRALVTYSLVASTLLDHQGTFAMRSNIVIRRARSCSILPGDTAREMPDMTTTPSQHYLCYTRATFSTIRRTPFLMSIFVSRRVRAFKSPANEQTSRELLPSDGRHPLLLCSFRQSPRCGLLMTLQPRCAAWSVRYTMYKPSQLPHKTTLSIETTLRTSLTTTIDAFANFTGHSTRNFSVLSSRVASCANTVCQDQMDHDTQATDLWTMVRFVLCFIFTAHSRPQRGCRPKWLRTRGSV